MRIVDDVVGYGSVCHIVKIYPASAVFEKAVSDDEVCRRVVYVDSVLHHGPVLYDIRVIRRPAPGNHPVLRCEIFVTVYFDWIVGGRTHLRCPQGRGLIAIGMP